MESAVVSRRALNHAEDGPGSYSFAEADRCICDRTEGGRLGNRAAWTGPDCSLRMCPADVSHDILSTQKQERMGDVGHVPAARTGGDTAPKVLNMFTTNGIHVPFDMNVDVEIVNSAQDVDATNNYGFFRYRRDVETLWSTPVSFSTVSLRPDRCRSPRLRPLFAAHRFSLGDCMQLSSNVV